MWGALSGTELCVGNAGVGVLWAADDHNVLQLVISEIFLERICA